MPTIGVQLTQYAGTSTTMTIELRAAGVLLNTGGDMLTEITGGYFTADISETLVASYDAIIKSNGVSVAEGELFGKTVVGDDFSLAAPANYLNAAALADNAITAAKVATDARTAIAAAVWNALTSGLTTTGSIGKMLVDRIVGVLRTKTEDETAETAQTTAIRDGLATEDQVAALTPEESTDVQAY